jgi:hypothetical protein
MTQHLGALSERVQTVEQWSADLEHPLVVESHRQAPDQDVEARRLRRLEALVA